MSAPDVREAARLLLCAIDNDERYHGLEAERMALWNALRAALASPDAPSGCIAAPVSPPAPRGDVEAMREACAKACDDIARYWDCSEDGKSDDAAALARKCSTAIRALPLPAAPAHDAVREAWRYLALLRHAHGLLLGGKAPADPERHSVFLNEIDALLAAERAQGEKGGE